MIKSDVSRILYLLLTFVYTCNDFALSQEMTDVEKVTNFGIYYTFEDFLKAFSSQESEKQNVDRLVSEFEKRCKDPKRVVSAQKNHPFIVIEGVHRTSRSIVGHKVAKKMGAQIVSNPPKYMSVLSELIPTGVIFRKAFFAIGIYGSACEARDLVDISPVLINGHWLFQASFAIAKLYGTKPPDINASIYSWPKDLFKPDLVFFINPPIIPNIANRGPRYPATPTPNYFRPVLIETFRRWKDPKVIEINSTYNYEDISKLVIVNINKELGTNYDADAPDGT